MLSIPLNAVTTRDKKDGKAAITTKDDKPETDNTIEKTTVVNGDLEEVVFVYSDATKTVKKVKVKTGIQDLNYIQILSGLKAGDEVVTGPYNFVSKTIKDGDKIVKTDKEKLFDDKKKD